MHSLLLVAIISLATLLQNSVPEKHTKSTHPQQHSEDTPADAKPWSQIVYIEAPRPDENVNAPTNTSTSEQTTPKWWQRPSITDWILAFTTTCYLFVNIFILIAIKRQAHIAEMSTDAVVSAERAWFDIHVSQSESASSASIQVTNHGRQFGILNDHVIIYARMTQEQFNKLPKKLEREEGDWDALILSKQSLPNGGILLPNTPTALGPPIDLASFVKQRDARLIDLFYFRVNYETLSHECYTEAVYLVNEIPFPISHFGLMWVPGFTHSRVALSRQGLERREHG